MHSNVPTSQVPVLQVYALKVSMFFKTPGNPTERLFTMG